MNFKKQLAFLITERYHNTSMAKEAESHFQKTVQEKDVETASQDLVLENLEDELLNICTKALPNESNSQLRRLIEQGAVSLNDLKKTDPKEILILHVGDIVKIGKRNFYKINSKE